MDQYNELPKTYAPGEFEDRIYQTWCEKGYFTPDVNNNAEHFSVVIPPPNVTGQLHMGHALDETLQDILVRYKRMQGYNTLWVHLAFSAASLSRWRAWGSLRRSTPFSFWNSSAR